jgi:hypothetical protein
MRWCAVKQVVQDGAATARAKARPTLARPALRLLRGRKQGAARWVAGSAMKQLPPIIIELSITFAPECYRVYLES